jgi:hypothetical protein
MAQEIEVGRKFDVLEVEAFLEHFVHLRSGKQAEVQGSWRRKHAFRRHCQMSFAVDLQPATAAQAL